MSAALTLSFAPLVSGMEMRQTEETLKEGKHLAECGNNESQRFPSHLTKSEVDSWVNKLFIDASPALIKLIQAPSHDAFFQKSKIKDIIERGTYAFVETFCDSKSYLSQEEQLQKFHELGDLLRSKKLPYQQIIGSYEGTVTQYSYLVLKSKAMDLREFRRTIFMLGQKFEQESVIISSNGKVQLIFTQGPNSGRAYLGEGFKETANRNFSLIKCHDENNEGTDNVSMSKQWLVIGDYNINRNVLSEIFDDFSDLIF